jgi:choice-of-anchor B domain-containing protein
VLDKFSNEEKITGTFRRASFAFIILSSFLKKRKSKNHQNQENKKQRTMKKIQIILSCQLIIISLFGQAQEATLLGRWQNDSLIGSSAHENVYNEIWGYAVNGHEYAIIGSTAGTHFIDVTNPNEPVEAHFVAGASQGLAIVHRDFHDYKGFLFAAAGEGGSSTLQVIDMRALPDTVKLVYNKRDISRTSHNIFIDTATAKLYALAADGIANGYAPLRILDISEPENPVFIGDYNEFGGIRPSHVHDAYVQNDIAFLNLGNDGLAIMDYTDPANPKSISTLTEYPSRGYNHSGWLSEDCNTYYLADENHGFDLKVLDVSNLCEPEVKGTFDAQVASTTSITHNQIVACNYLYVSYYYDGLRVYDISEPHQPALVRYYDTYLEPDGGAYRGAWGVYPFLPSGNILVSDMQSGLFVFEGMGDSCHSQARVNNCLQSQICTFTSTQDFLKEEGLSIAPNPVKDELLIDINLSLAFKDLEIALLSAEGKQVGQWTYKNLSEGKNELSILLPKTLSSGLYFLSLRSDKNQITKKVVISTL